ncbi:hypothetical protein BQ8420_14785 [Nocardiopsis sp. JB363]|nr:hypothetical protein BQ8420_14785 [Nocardiopsis sp. JB363]
MRLTVPAADESSQAWIDLQDDPSTSMRMLIRESIQRDGYVDVVNRPVEQQPRRGRPPKGEEEPLAQLPQLAADDDEIDGPDPVEADPVDEPRYEAEDAEERADRMPPAEEPKTKKPQAPSGLASFLTGS